MSGVERAAAAGVAAAEPRLGAVVLTYGSDALHEPLLDSLLGQGVAPGQVVVVHNPAVAGEPDPAVPPGCELIRATHNLGYAAAMNRGIERQLGRGAELLLILTHDARLRPGALAALLAAAAAHPDFGALAPRLVFAGTDTPFSFGGLTRSNGSTAHLTAPRGGAGGIASCDWVDGGTILFRAAALERAGDFDERFWGYCEEAELCLRLKRAGFRIGVVTAAVAEQSPGSKRRFGPWSYLMTRNGAAYAWRAAGLRGVARASADAVLEVLLELARVVARGLRLRRGPAAEPWALAVGTGRGLLDFYRRRWGPPPALPGAGDVSNVVPPAEGDGPGG